MKLWVSLLIMVQMILFALPVGADISSNTRLLQKPEWDGAIISGNWLNGEFRYQQGEIGGNEDINVLALGATFATSLPDLPKLELGARAWLMHADYDHFDSEFGLSDIDCWGKYQFYNQNQLLLSAGLMLSLPLGSDGVVHPRASGELNIEAFAAARYQASTLLTFIGHIGIRNNGDMEFDLDGAGPFGNSRGEFDGETQLEIGGGAIYQLQPNLNFLGELNIASEAYEDSDSDIGLTLGLDYLLRSNMTLKGGLGLGLDDGAPDIELIIGCSRNF